MIFVLLFSSFSFSASAAEKTGTVLDKQREAVKEHGVNVNVLSENELDFLEDKEKSIKTIVSFKEDLVNSNFENFSMKKDDSKLKYSGQTEDGIVDMYMSNDTYINEKTNELIVTTVIYDSYSDQIIQFLAEKRSMDDAEKTEILINWKNKDRESFSKNKKKDTVIVADNSGEKNQYAVNKKKKKKKFKWNGKSFVCSMGGLLACGQYCAVWALVNPIAGGTCSAVCGTAFAAVCAFA
jgi:putative immunity protein/bacteriocin